MSNSSALFGASTRHYLVRAYAASLHGTRHLGHVELVQAGSGTLMILRHTAPLSAADKEKLERFCILRGLSLFHGAV